jgi:drug/metabolite transporter (DMT)-like permease
MGRLENLPENRESFDQSGSANPIGHSSGGASMNAAPMNAEQLRHAQDLQDLQQEVVTHLLQDVRRLQTEKSRLLNEIEKLQNQHEAMQSQHNIVLSQQQQAQQQAWAKQLALAMANHLQAALSQKLHQSPPFAPFNSPFGDPADLVELTPTARNPQLSSLDDTLNRTFTALRNDLNSYQSALSQQIDRMHNMGQQGEAILEVLVRRISHQLQLEAARNQANQHPYQLSGEGFPAQPPEALSGPRQTERAAQPGNQSDGQAGNKAAGVLKNLSSFQLGLILILLSTMALSLHNVAVGIVGSPSKLFGVMPIGGFISLNSLGSSLLLLWMRMLVVVPLMAFGLASTLHRPVWRDVKSFCLSKDQRLYASVFGSGFFLFLSQVLIYIAIGLIGPGVAVTILFMYPLVTVPLAWALFGDRPTLLRTLVMLMITSGIALTTLKATAANLSGLGVSAAITSGVCFALYLLTMQVSFRKMHPVPVSLIQFSTIFVFSSLCLITIGIDKPPSNWGGLLSGSLILGSLTLAGYLLNNFGVRYMGAARASIIAASGPALTALLAVVINPGLKTFLSPAQIVGILVVTLGVVLLSFEKMLLQQQMKPVRSK